MSSRWYVRSRKILSIRPSIQYATPSTGTARTHTASIYRKLDVRNRTRAVARARELGLLED
jgi:hypothetical protein